MSSTPIRDVLLPSSDRTVLIQVIVVVTVTIAATYWVRKERSLVLLTVGLGTFVLGLMALRTVH